MRQYSQPSQFSNFGGNLFYYAIIVKRPEKERKKGDLRKRKKKERKKDITGLVIEKSDQFRKESSKHY